MSKKVVFLASMMLLALAVHAQTEDSDKAEVLKRHQSKYGASKHGHQKKYNYKQHKPDYHKEEPSYKDEPKHKEHKYAKEEPSYKTHGDEPRYQEPKYDEPKYGKEEPSYKTHGDYNAPDYAPKYNEEYDTNRGGDYYGEENDGYYNGDQEYYSDAYDSVHMAMWCEGDTLKDSLEYALKKFEDLSLYRDALDGLTDADWETLKVNQTSLLTIFAPCNQAMKQVPGMFDEDFMVDFTNNREKLKEFIASTITTKGAFKTWDLTDDLELPTLDTSNCNTTLTVEVVDTRDYGEGMDHEIAVKSSCGNKEAKIIRPSNIRVCKSIVHTLSRALPAQRQT